MQTAIPSSVIPRQDTLLSWPANTPIQLSTCIACRGHSASSHTCSLSPQCVPNVAVKVIISGQEEAATLAEGDARDATDDVIVAVHGQLLVRPDVKHPACGIVTSGGKCVTIGEKLKWSG